MVLACSFKIQIRSLANPLVQNLEREECPRYTVSNFKLVLRETKKKMKFGQVG